MCSRAAARSSPPLRTANTQTCTPASRTPTARSVTRPEWVSGSNRSSPTCTCGTYGSPAGKTQAAIDRIVLSTRTPGRRRGLPRRRRLQPCGELPDARHADRRTRSDQRLHRAADLLPVHPAARNRPADHSRLPLAVGHRLVWCSRAFGAQNPTVRRLWPSRLRRSSFYWKLVALDRRFGVATGSNGCITAHRWSEWSRTSRYPCSARATSSAGSMDTVPIEPVWLCPVRVAAKSPGDPTPPGRSTHPPEKTYVNVGFWSTVPSTPGHPGATNRAHRKSGPKHGWPQVPILGLVLHC